MNDRIISEEGLTFDDILLVPGKSRLKRQDIDISVNLSEKIKLKIPFISSPMDTVTDEKMAVAVGRIGGLGIIHRNMESEKQAKAVSKAKNSTEIVGAAVGVGADLQERAKMLHDAGADVIVIDSAQGYSDFIIEATEFIKTKYPDVFLISGNIATQEGARALIEAGADCIRVGMGPGSICTTRVVAGIGVPQVTAIMDSFKAGEGKIPMIADGGIRYPGDVTKALASGGSVVMLGSVLAGSSESPGEIVEIEGKKYKKYRGMGSVSAMMEGSAARYGQDYKKGGKSKLVAEGVEGLVEYKGDLEDIMHTFTGGLRSGMYYTGSENIPALWKTKFIKITNASLIESHPHDIQMANSKS